MSMADGFPSRAAAQGIEILVAGYGREWFYERGCQEKTLLHLLEVFLFLGIQPPLMTSSILNARVLAGFFAWASARFESGSELEQALGVG